MITVGLKSVDADDLQPKICHVKYSVWFSWNLSMSVSISTF